MASRWEPRGRSSVTRVKPSRRGTTCATGLVDERGVDEDDRRPLPVRWARMRLPPPRSSTRAGPSEPALQLARSLTALGVQHDLPSLPPPRSARRPPWPVERVALRDRTSASRCRRAAAPASRANARTRPSPRAARAQRGAVDSGPLLHHGQQSISARAASPTPITAMRPPRASESRSSARLAAPRARG